MKWKIHNLAYIIMLIVCALPMAAQGQRILRVAVDSTACMSDSVRVGMGYSWRHEVVVMNYRTALLYSEPAFLPDGVPCGDMGCSYRSPVTFEDFSDTAVIRNANDINFVRLNMEHSYIGDLYINITCPNGQKASLMNYGGTGHSTCNSSIPSGHRGWNTRESNMSTGTYFGFPIDQESSLNSCDSTASGNEAGTGWNYCWSSNTANGYQYASGDGIIYRSGHVVSYAGHNTVDSSDVAAGTNFYHPEQNFATLVGCPVNGDWYIEVLDGWGSDNGYIFEWELSLNPELVGEQGGLVSAYELEGDSVHRVNDSTFMVYPPAGATGDTTVTFTAKVYDNVGNWVDTTFDVHFMTLLHRRYEGKYCMGDTVRIDELVITSTTQRVDTVLMPGDMCPTVREVDLVFHPSYDLYDTLKVCPNASHIYAGVEYADGDYVIRDTTAQGCDSITRLAVRTVDAGFKADMFISDDTTAGWFRDTVLAGCEPYTVYMKAASPLTASCQWYTADTGWFNGNPYTHTYDSAGVYSITLAATSINGCRDTATIRNRVRVYEVPEADFWWEPEPPVMSHPNVVLLPVEGEGRLGYTWTVQRGGGDGYDTLYGAPAPYSWFTEGDNIFGDFNVTLIEVRHHTGPYGGPIDCYDTVEKAVTIVNDWLQFPNLVTPNGDGINDIWKVVNLLECGMYSMNELWVYSAWGSLVYHAENIATEEEFWDPNETGSPDGTYYYRFSARSLYGIVKRNGAIEVVR